MDIGEIICGAVDTIVTKRLEGLRYDITKICTIVDDSNRADGEYVVTDNGGRYKVYSSITTYRKGNSVLVNIPNGDYGLLKTITGLYKQSSNLPFTYVSPLSLMTIIDNNGLFSMQKASGSLLANSNRIKEQPSGSYIKIAETITNDDFNEKWVGYNRLGIRADFKCALSKMSVISGEYGIVFLIKSEEKQDGSEEKQDGFEEKQDGSEEPKIIYSLLFLNNYDMYGNPYAFDGYFSLEKVFDISSIDNIVGIEAYLYLQGNFKTLLDTLLKYEDINNLPDNIFVNNIEIFLGYESGKFNEETILLYTNNSLEFDYSTTSEDIYKTVYLKWFVEKDEGSGIFEPVNENDSKYEVRWYKRSDLYNSDIDEGWVEVNLDKEENSELDESLEEITFSNKFSYTFLVGKDKLTEQIRVIGKHKSSENSDSLEISKEDINENKEEAKIPLLPQAKTLKSNILTFKNKNIVGDARTLNALRGLSIEFNDGSDGNYFIFNENGKKLIPSNEPKLMTVKYNGEKFEDILDKNIPITEVKWLIPTNNCMLSFNDIKNPYYTNLKNDKLNVTSYKGVSYTVYKYKRPSNMEKNDFTFNYSIADVYTSAKSNNNIVVIATIDGIECEVIKELKFGRSGSNGSNYNLVLTLEGTNAVNMSLEDKSFRVRADLYNANGLAMELPKDNEGNINWSWSFTDSIGKDTLESEENIPEGVQRFKINSSTMNKEYCGYVTCKMNVNGLELQSRLGIPLKASDNYWHIDGVKEIIYNHLGVPNCYSGPYKIFGENINQEEYKWTLNKNSAEASDNTAEEVRLVPQLKNNCLIPSAIYPGDDDGNNFSVICKKDDSIVWILPVLISLNHYDIDLLNQWDGMTEETDKYILSAMLGAGRKNNNNNTFSGVLIGDMATGTGNGQTEKATGIYGFDEGIVAYSLTEDGKATFGKSGSGQIKITGSEANIKNGTWDTEKYGMLIDFDDGLINIKGKPSQSPKESQTEILISPGNKTDLNNKFFPYLLVKDKKGTDLIHIGNDGYYLLSSGYNEQSGTKLDLESGSFYSKSDYGSVLITSEGNENNKKDFLRVNVINERDEDIPVLSFGQLGNYIQSKSYGVLKLLSIENNGTKYYIYQYAPMDQNILTFYCNYNYPSRIDPKTEEENLYWEKDNPPEPDTETAINRGDYFAVGIGIVGTSKIKEIYKLSANKDSLGDEIDFPLDKYYDYEWDETDKKYYIIGEKNKEQYKTYLLSNSIQVYEAEAKGEGMKIDLDAGTINGYNLYLKGVSESGSGSFVLDSSNTISPLVVLNSSGDTTFSVDWDGTLNCSKVNSLNNDGRTQYAISIGKNFYVTSNGSAGGGTWHGSSTGVLGFGTEQITSTNGQTYTIMAR